MTRSFAATALAAALLTGCASSNSGTVWRSAGHNPTSSSSLVVLNPTLVATENGTRVHCMVCRTPATVATQAGSLRLQRLSASGQVIDTTTAQLATSLNQRNRACDAYDIQTGWQLATAETVRVTASR